MRAALACLIFLATTVVAGRAAGADPAAIEHALDLAGPGVKVAGIDLSDAMAMLKIPSASVAVIEGGRLDFAARPLAEAIVRRAAIAYGWPTLPPFGD